jgi:hypothetical protein
MMGSAALTGGTSDVAVIKPAASRQGLRNIHPDHPENPEKRRRWLSEMSVMFGLQFLGGLELPQHRNRNRSTISMQMSSRSEIRMG